MSDEDFRAWCQKVYDDLKAKDLGRNQANISIVQIPQPEYSANRENEMTDEVHTKACARYNGDIGFKNGVTCTCGHTNATQMLKIGGIWLTIMREFIRDKAFNGGYNLIGYGVRTKVELKGVCIEDMEKLAAKIAATAINEYVERMNHETRIKQIFANMTANVVKKVSQEMKPADTNYKFKEPTYSDAATSSHFSVYPRYTGGSPAMVPRAMALRIAASEKEACDFALQDHIFADHELAKEKGLAGIVEEVWESNGKLWYRDVLTDERGEKKNMKGAR